MDALAAAGVRRVSTGSALSRAARAAFISAARDIRDRGSFEWVDAAIRNSA
jgi:2-methylisocitrate lyase-like PEP mutase family enzyme